MTAKIKSLFGPPSNALSRTCATMVSRLRDVPLPGAAVNVTTSGASQLHKAAPCPACSGTAATPGAMDTFIVLLTATADTPGPAPPFGHMARTK